MIQVTKHWPAGGQTATDDPDWPTVPTSMGGGEIIEWPFALTEVSPARTFCSADVAIVVRLLGEADVQCPERPNWEKRYWCPSFRGPRESRGAMAPARANSYVILLEATEEQLGHPGEVVASMSPWPSLWQHDEPDPRIWRGVFSPSYARQILFLQDVDIQVSGLPRWKPHVAIDLRRLEREDE